MSAVMSSGLGTKVWRFPGGLKLDGHKAMSTRSAIETAAIPGTLILPLSQHIGAAAKPLVEVGDHVYRGQAIAAPDGYVSTPIHASSSGTVVAIEDRPVPHPSGLSAPCIVIETDGRDTPLPEPELKAHPDYTELDPSHLRNLVRQAGVVGLGGAAFPSFIKLNPGLGTQVEALILNGAECEPYISCDQVLMREAADDIVHGAQLIMHAVQAPQCLIGVEDNKPESIEALKKALDALGDTRIRVVVVPTRYPQGGEKQLVQALTGREVPSEGLPLDIGIICHNVGTAAAVWRAITRGEPLISRIITVTGGAVNEPRNFEVRLGTPVADLLALANNGAGGTHGEPARLVMGGPMMGFALSGDEVPVVKATNCILAATPEEVAPPEPAMPCIRCGECAEVCPAGLLPQQLYWHARARDFDKTQDYKLFDCIECGCCAQVCPSHIPLVQYYRFAKTEIWEAEREKRKSNHARERHEFRQQRMEREEAEKKARLEAKKAALKKSDKQAEKPKGEAPPADDDPVAAAIARAKQRKAEQQTQPDEQASAKADKTDQDEKSDRVDDLIVRAKAKSAAKKAANEKKAEAMEEPADDAKQTRDDPVASAIAKAKAKAAEKKKDEQAESSQTESNAKADDQPAENDPVAAAIARAKAKAAEKKADRPAPDQEDTDAQSHEDPGKTQSKPSKPDAPSDEDDPVAAAIARAKAKAAEKKAQRNQGDEGES